MEDKLLTPVARSVMVTPARRTTETVEILRPPFFVPLAEEIELKEILTGNGTQNKTGTQYEIIENFKRTSLFRLGTARAPNSLDAVSFC